MTISTIKDISEILMAITSIICGLFAIYTYYKDRKRNKKKDTLDAYNDLQNKSLNMINKWKPSEIKEVIHNKQSNEFKELSGYLADIERFCVGLNVGIYDLETFYEIAHGYFESDRGLLPPRILPLIEEKNKNSDGEYYNNIQLVMNRMKSMN